NQRSHSCGDSHLLGSWIEAGLEKKGGITAWVASGDTRFELRYHACLRFHHWRNYDRANRGGHRDEIARFDGRRRRDDCARGGESEQRTVLLSLNVHSQSRDKRDVGKS